MEKSLCQDVMEYSEFVEKIKKMSESVAGTEGTVQVTHVIKNNGCEYDGLVILRKGCKISPTIYLNGYYEQYCKGKSFESVFSGIKELYLFNKDRITVDADSFATFNGIRDKVVFKLINYNANRKLLSLVPHKKILDLAMVFCCMLEKNEEGNTSALIYNSNMNYWKVKEEDIYRAALNNTARILPAGITEMSKLFEAYDDHDKMDVCIDSQEIKDCQLYVLTNDCRINGAACMLYENVLKDFADSIESNLYILPSSIHEVIILPKFAMFNKQELVNMVREVNAEGVAMDEILSYTVYEYDRETGELSM